MAEIIYCRYKISQIKTRYLKYDVNRVHYCYLDRNRDKVTADHKTLLEVKTIIRQHRKRFGLYGALYRIVASECEKVMASLSEIINIIGERIFCEDSDYENGDQFYEEYDEDYM